ncbi:MAG: pectate lyase [Bacteroidaceae bacterium]|nr:pectate lyase [Bacteroidaceae bacterium]
MEADKDFLQQDKDYRTLKAFLFIAWLLFCTSLSAQDVALADSIVKYQLPSGGWPKNQDWLQGADQAYMEECRRTGIGSTIDNGATTGELKVLAGVIVACKTQKLTNSKTYQAAFLRGVDYLLGMQYENGGWPQFWPRRSASSYSNHITFNDNAMVNVMRLLKDVADGKHPYGGVGVKRDMRKRCAAAFWRGVQCILDCQIRDAEGRPTVWCQQHDEVTLAPASARKYELAAYCGHGETVDIIGLLIDLYEEQGGDTLKYRIDCAVNWLKGHAIHGMKLEMFTNAEGRQDKRFVPSAGAPNIWARYYDLETDEPLFSDRHGLPLKDFNAIGYERRNGYSWLGDSPKRVIERWGNLKIED